MKVTLDLSQRLVHEILTQAEDDVTFDTCVTELLTEAIIDRKNNEMPAGSTADIASRMIIYALKNTLDSTPFTVSVWYQRTYNKDWLKLQPNKRKSLGKRIAAEVAAFAGNEAVYIAAWGKTQQDASLYCVVRKEAGND